MNKTQPCTSLALSHSLIGMDKNSVSCLYKLDIFHLLVPSGELKIISRLDLFNFFFTSAYFQGVTIPSAFSPRGAAAKGRWLKMYSFLNPPNGVIVIRHFSSCFNSSENQQMLAHVLLIYRGKKTEWHFFHCLTQYGEVALFARLKSARDDIQLLVLI